MTMTNMSKAAAFVLTVATLGCGPGEVVPEPDPECVQVDELLGVPGSRLWCNGEYEPETPWEGELAVKLLTICLPPRADDECELCPLSEVSEAVGQELDARLAEYQPMCKLEHWELGCMRTIENAMVMGFGPDYCCFQVALWGENCKN